MKAIPSVFDEVKLVVKAEKNLIALKVVVVPKISL